MIQQMAATVQQLFPVLERCWAADTSATPEAWTAANPALGQCAGTALIVQDFFGGDLLRTTYDGQSHYWNLLSVLPWLEADLTRGQFPALVGPMPSPQRSTRESVLSSPDTVRRYTLLKSRIEPYVHVR